MPLGSYLFMSRYMVEATRAYVAAEAVRTLKQSVSLRAFSWKFCRNYYATDLGAQAATQFGAFDPLTAATPERGPGRLRINGLPRRNIPAEALGLITMT